MIFINSRSTLDMQSHWRKVVYESIFLSTQPGTCNFNIIVYCHYIIEETHD